MIYSRCFYLMMFRAEERLRSDCSTSRKTIESYINYVCEYLQCRLTEILVGAGYVVIIVDINAQISASDFVSKLKCWTSKWILSKSGPCDSDECYWMDGVGFRALSPADIGAASRFVADLPPDTDAHQAAKQLGLEFCNIDDANISSAADMSQSHICHHIILITSRSRLLLREKYNGLLDKLVQEIVGVYGGALRCSARRNHLHILCHVPANVSIGQFIEKIKTSLLDCMHSNIHFRRFDGWDDNSIVFTVSQRRIDSEEHTIADQKYIHSKMPNEMAIYMKLPDVTWVTSLW